MKLFYVELRRRVVQKVVVSVMANDAVAAIEKASGVEDPPDEKWTTMNVSTVVFSCEPSSKD